jgi:DNA-binding Lrp family transcriptional regulator
MHDEFIFEFNFKYTTIDELFLIPPSESYTRQNNFFYENIFRLFVLIPTLKYYIFFKEFVTIAFVLIKSDLGAQQKVVEQLKKIEQISLIDRTFGDYDIVVKMESEHVEKIREVISWNIKKLDKVRSTLTLIKKE